MNTFSKITGGKENTPAEVYAKFPWLERASFRSAIVDIANNWFVWKDGTWEGGFWEDGIWKDGIWKGGFWEDGFWEDGTWEDGTWKGGFWEGGKIWDNIKQRYHEVSSWNKEKKEFVIK